MNNRYMEYSEINLNQRYVTSSHKTYIMGLQNGDFEQAGEHLADEMCGVWNHPIKWLDGYWFGLSEQNGLMNWLKDGIRFETYPYKSVLYHKVNGASIAVEQMCPVKKDGVVIKVTIRNCNDSVRTMKFHWCVRTDIIPVWKSEDLNLVYGEDVVEKLDEIKGVIAKDNLNESYVLAGCVSAAEHVEVQVGESIYGLDKTPGKGKSIVMTQTIELKENEEKELCFIISGSNISRVDAINKYNSLASNVKGTEDEAIAFYERIKEASGLSCEDKELEKVYTWTKFHTQWLVRDIEGFGKGLGAGLPEYPWWFGCDNSYAVQGALVTGEHQLAKDTLNLIRILSERHNGNGRIIHESTTNGVIINPGNTQETAHFIVAVYEVFKWSGDIKFLKANYDYMKKGIQWLFNDMDTNGNLLPEGYGITEIEGLNVELIDTAVYSCEALRAMSIMTEIIDGEKGTEGISQDSAKYRGLYEKLRSMINEQLFLEEDGLYADAMVTPAKILSRIDKMITRMYELEKAPWAGEWLKKYKGKMEQLPLDKEIPTGIFHNWAINTPMDAGIADRDKALTALKSMEKYQGEYGLYLSGIIHKRMMTISTAVQAVGEARYGRIDKSLKLLKLTSKTFGKVMPGSITEMSPDYGCTVQAWTNYGYSKVIVMYLFGLQPNAYYKTLVFAPNIPKEWKSCKLTHVKVGETFVDVIVDVDSIKLYIDKSWKVEVCVGDENIDNGESNENVVKRDIEIIKR